MKVEERGSKWDAFQWTGNNFEQIKEYVDSRPYYRLRVYWDLGESLMFVRGDRSRFFSVDNGKYILFRDDRVDPIIVGPEQFEFKYRVLGEDK